MLSADHQALYHYFTNESSLTPKVLSHNRQGSPPVELLPTQLNCVLPIQTSWQRHFRVAGRAPMSSPCFSRCLCVGHIARPTPEFCACQSRIHDVGATVWAVVDSRTCRALIRIASRGAWCRVRPDVLVRWQPSTRVFICLRKYSVTQLQPQSELQGPIPADLKYVPSAEHA